MTVLVRPELPAGADPLSAPERRAIALAALGHTSLEITGKLAEEKHSVPAVGLGPMWAAAAKKLGAERSRPQGRQPELVFRARVHGVLDVPDPEEVGWLPPDVLGYIQAMARGRTLKQYAQDDLGVAVWDVDQIADHARKLLGQPPTQASMVYRALPQLLRTVQPPVEDVGTDLVPAARATAIVASLQTELPGEPRAVRAGRMWIRAVLPALRWAGPILKAAEVVTRLLENAVRHGLTDHAKTQTLSLRVAVNEAGDLLIDVSDLNPSFPDFDAAVRGEKGQGLWRVDHLGARVTWFLPHEGTGKTVRAVLAPGPVDL
ncbi:ATP-binding protein [Streptomyces coeruleorubidus]|uniref:ATP-binding protein n=1 Tax=Streptomyces coeruleorubidus TaxID=116188 RepID=UPI0033B53BFB